jgi:hypothetical protein
MSTIGLGTELGLLVEKYVLGPATHVVKFSSHNNWVTRRVDIDERSLEILWQCFERCSAR